MSDKYGNITFYNNQTVFNESFDKTYKNLTDITALPSLEACDSWKQFLLSALYLFTSLFSFIGNLISIIVLIFGKRSSPELKKYLINLSISDILMALFSIPFTYTDFMLGRWVLPSILCPFAQFITIFSLCASVVTLTAIGIERYMAIIHPLRINQTNKYRSVLMFSIWLLATLLASPQLFTTKTIPYRYGNNTYQKCREVASRFYSTNYSIIIFIITFIMPFFTLVYVYGCIGFKMFRKQIPGLNHHQNNNSMSNKLKTVKISAVVVAMFIICWLPIQLFNLIIWYKPYLLMKMFNLNMDSYMALFFVCHWISSAHSFVNPIIYCFMSHNFREDLHTVIVGLIPRFCAKQSDNHQINYKQRTPMMTSIETKV